MSCPFINFLYTRTRSRHFMFFHNMSLEDLCRISRVSFELESGQMTITYNHPTEGDQLVWFSGPGARDDKIMTSPDVMFACILPLLQVATGLKVTYEMRSKPGVKHFWRFTSPDSEPSLEKYLTDRTS